MSLESSSFYNPRSFCIFRAWEQFWQCFFRKLFFLKSNFERATFKMYFLRKQFWKCIFWGSDFWNLFSQKANFKMHLFREQPFKYIFWGSSFNKYLRWLLLFEQIKLLTSLSFLCFFTKLFTTSKNIHDFDRFKKQSKIID